MILTMYGKKGNVWTDKARAALEDVHDYTLIEEFEWARDKFGRDEACRVDEQGVAWVCKMPTIRVAKWARNSGYVLDPHLIHYIFQPGDEWWIIGVDDCLAFIERFRDEMLKLQCNKRGERVGWGRRMSEMPASRRVTYEKKRGTA